MKCNWIFCNGLSFLSPASIIFFFKYWIYLKMMIKEWELSTRVKIKKSLIKSQIKKKV
jgi:hypothetical protein